MSRSVKVLCSFGKTLSNLRRTLPLPSGRYLCRQLSGELAQRRGPPGLDVLAAPRPLLPGQRSPRILARLCHQPSNAAPHVFNQWLVFRIGIRPEFEEPVVLHDRLLHVPELLVDLATPEVRNG